MSSLPCGTGVLSAMDERGQNVLEACTAYGVKVPDDILVIGIDNDPLLTTAKRYMLCRYQHSSLQMSDIAEHCGVSRRLIEMHFSRYVGCAPMRFLTDIRMERAVALVIERTQSVSEIAALCGFSSANYFTKSFRRYYGVSPSNYVKKMYRAVFSRYKINSCHERKVLWNRILISFHIVIRMRISV